MSKQLSKPKLSRRRFLRLTGIGAVTALVAGSSIWANSYRLSVSHNTRQFKQLAAPIRIAQLSDLHFGHLIGEKTVAKWVDATLEEAPDLIVITGDLIDWSVTDTTPLIRQLARLKAKHGVYGAWGNHDYDLGRRFKRDFETQLNSAGITMLKNEGLNIRDDLYLAGLDDVWDGTPNVAKALLARNQEQMCLLMVHNPDMLPDLPTNIDLTLCGHTHGGQIKFPFVGAVHVPSAYGTRFVEGWIEEAELPLAYVSRGMGMVSLPIRFLSQAELAIFDFTS